MAGSQASENYDAVIVGASLAGCAGAILLARGGARVALVEQRPDPTAFKRICSHYIQPSAVPTLERLGLLEPMLAAGALRSQARIWTRWGWIEEPAHDPSVPGVNLRRERLDPLVREMAAQTPGVELMLGRTVTALVREGEAFAGVTARDRHGEETTVRARLVVGADGRDSRVAKLSGVKRKTVPHGRFAYGGYWEGPMPEGAPGASLWLLDPHMAAAFPTDNGLVFYAAMPTMGLLPQFRADPAKALVDFISKIPEAPPILASRQFEDPSQGPAVQGKIDMTNVAHTPTAPGLALVGDAALAIDPLWGVGCGWAFQSAEWMADAVAPALLADQGSRGSLIGESSLDRALRRYRRRHARGLAGHAAMMYGYAGGRKFNPIEKLFFSAAARDEAVARVFQRFGTRTIGPARMFASAAPRLALAAVRGSLRGSSRALGEASSPQPL